MAARKIIAPRSPLPRAHPDVVLDIVIDDSLSDIVAGRFDAGIRVGERLEKDMAAVRSRQTWRCWRSHPRLPRAPRRAQDAHRPAPPCLHQLALPR